MLCLFFVIQSPKPSVGQQQTAIQLMWQCLGRGEIYDSAIKASLYHPEEFGTFDQLACSAYFSGMVDMNSLFAARFGQGMFCLPSNGITSEQQIHIFIEWVGEHPEDVDKTARLMVPIALAYAFPCP
jgi:hypothetical protein